LAKTASANASRPRLCAQVINAGISGNDVGQELSRLDGVVGRGTRLVVLDTAYSNSAGRGVNIAATVDQISARLRARGIKRIVIPNMHAWADYRVRPDRVHITEQGHAAVATHLLPLVIAALAQADDQGGHRRKLHKTSAFPRRRQSVSQIALATSARILWTSKPLIEIAAYYYAVA
jgi:lysophospholipase L1-like esterase